MRMRWIGVAVLVAMAGSWGGDAAGVRAYRFGR